MRYSVSWSLGVYVLGQKTTQEPVTFKGLSYEQSATTKATGFHIKQSFIACLVELQTLSIKSMIKSEATLNRFPLNPKSYTATRKAQRLILISRISCCSNKKISMYVL